MALSQSALSELLDAFRADDGVNLVRESVRMVMQELIEAEAVMRIGACSRHSSRGRSGFRRRRGIKEQVDDRGESSDRIDHALERIRQGDLELDRVHIDV
jgi:hypothetical protein